MNPETPEDPETQQHVSQTRELQEEKASASEERKTSLWQGPKDPFIVDTL